jgi:copper transport protein
MLLGAVLVPGGRPDELTHPVFRFSTLATSAVTVLIATGVYQTLREVRSWDVLLHSHYGHVLVVKLGLVGLSFLAAAGSRTWVWQTVNPVVPVLAATSGPTSGPASGSADGLPDGRPSLGRLRASVGAETTMLVAVLAVTAMLVTSDPALAAPQPHPVSANLTVGPDRVHVSAVPSGPRRLQLTLRVTDAAGKPTEPKEVDASLRLPSSDIGPLPVTLTGGAGMHMGSGPGMAAGTYAGVVGVPVAGTWQLAVTVRTTAIDEATAYVDVPIG